MPRVIRPALPALLSARRQPPEHADRHVVLVGRAEARADARRVGVVGVAAGVDARALALALVGLVQAQHPAQELERRDDPRRAARGGLGDQQRVAAVAGGGEAALAREEELAVDPRRLRLALDVLREQELRVVGLVPDRPQADAVAVAPADGGRERLELLRPRLGHVVAALLGRPLGHGPVRVSWMPIPRGAAAVEQPVQPVHAPAG